MKGSSDIFKIWPAAAFLLFMVQSALPAGADETELLADAPWLCRSVDTQIALGKLAEAGDGEGMRSYLNKEVEKGECRVAKAEAKVTIIDVDQRGYVLVEERGQAGQWWVAHLDVWPPEEADEQLRTWTKP